MNSTESIPFALPDLTEAEIDAVVGVLRSGWLTTGSKAREFEHEFARAVGGHHAVAVNSCTAAMHLALEALGVKEGDRVYLSPYTFAATAEVVRYLGAIPVLVDIDPLTCNVDTSLLEETLRSDSLRFPGRLKAIMPVHFAGTPCDMQRIWALAREFNLAVVEDAAHAFPASRDGVTVGSMPRDVRGAVCFSFYATKTITTGEGGMLVTNDAALADRARSMSLHGLSRAAWGRYQGGSWRYDITDPGYKYNLTDMAAALGLVQLQRADAMRERRSELAAAYGQAFSANKVLQVPMVPAQVSSAWHLYVLRVADAHERQALIDHLGGVGIGTSVHFIPLHLHSYYSKTYGYKPTDFPNAFEQFERSLSLPLYSSMTDEQVSRVIAEVIRWVENGDAR